MGAADEEKSPETDREVTRPRRSCYTIAASASHQVSANSSCDCQQCIEGARGLSCSYARHASTAHVLPGALRRSIAKRCMPKRKSGRGSFITPMRCWQSQLLIGFFDWGFFLHQRLPYWWRLTAFSYEAVAHW